MDLYFPDSVISTNGYHTTYFCSINALSVSGTRDKKCISVQVSICPLKTFVRT